MDPCEDDGKKTLRKQNPHHHGHRERLRKRYLRSGFASFSDYELLELLLCFAIPRVDVKPLAKKTIEQFGGLSKVLAAPPSKLSQFKGIGEAASVLINLVQALGLRQQIRDIEKKPILNQYQKVVKYCTDSMGHETTEQLRILYLNKKNMLLADEIQHRGTVDHTPFYPREIIKMAIEMGATALIIVHNHPSGDPTPSPQDIDMTRNLAKACSIMNITLHDHLIIARDSHVSMKSLQLF